MASPLAGATAAIDGSSDSHTSFRKGLTTMARRMVMMDGNQAVTHVAHKINEVFAIYPITPGAKRTSGERSRMWWRCSRKAGRLLPFTAPCRPAR